MKNYKCTPVAIALMFLLLCCTLHAQPPSHTGKFSPYIDDNVNGFWEYLPRNYNVDLTSRYALLVFFHGAGEQGSDQSMTTLNRVLRAGPPKLINTGGFPDSFFVAGQWHKFVVISPQIKNGIVGVSSTIQPSTVEAVIQYALSTYRIDPTRIYLCGLSMGGGAVWDYAGSSLTAASKLAAISVAAGAADLTTQQANNIAEGDLPVLATHNLDDNVISASRTVANIAAINAYSPGISPAPRPVYWNLGGHNVWRRTFEDILPGSTPNGNLRDTLGISVYEWFLQQFRAAVVLPVTWQSFTVRGESGTAYLQWTVSNQVNVKEYVVEKSNNGRQWTTVTAVQAQTGANNLTYSVTDVLLVAGTTFYRIRQSDFNGNTSYSPVKTITADGVVKLLAYPNPFRSFIKIDADLPAGTVTVRLTDNTGRTVATAVQQSGNRELTITNLDNLPPATYYLSIHSASGILLKQIPVIKNQP